MLRFLSRSFAVAIGCAGLLAGCGGAPPASAVLIGKVMLDGQPLSQAQVMLTPEKGRELGSHVATTDANGEFIVRPTTSTDRALEPGTYVVSVSKYAGDSGSMARKNIVPPPYASETKSPLKVTINPGENQPPPFELSSRKK